MGVPFAGVGLDYHITGMVITDSRLFGVGHMVRRWADGIAERYKIYVREEAPINRRSNTGHGPPGLLKAGLDTHVERVGPRILVTAVTSAAPYTKYVAGGTSGPIYGNRSSLMKVPLNAGFTDTKGHYSRDGTATLHFTVSGQRANDFFGRAYDRVALRHSSLRGAGQAFRLAPHGSPGAPNPYRY